MKVYDTVLSILRTEPSTRNSDKRLVWEFWRAQGCLKSRFQEQFMDSHTFITRAMSPDTISRCRRKIQETHPELRSAPPVQALKDKKEATQGTFIYREQF